ncbi:MAG: DNA primase [Bacteroidetes bacterium RIFOXYA12_FULL_35_11]|nr:MAG: DNA primase [Bacteroidetes bacterium GWF2_35_48]OFY73436.1 MAG: DNA primase [Bacteroidetes bacterium RIFOXYA12_FULL_35_11]OFY92542.1 MAG: DNA primase [Bacteroidetes bacterium RIFOXYB2_FULL_35_7]HBX51267.1 DNA primase [Bacteroidales bacterium]
MIDQPTIQRIHDASEIIDVISDYVTLKRRGANHLGLCPFHNEKTPSFTVSGAKGIYKCFGCGKGGNAVNFIMDIEHLTYPDALKHLAKKYHIEVKEAEQTQEQIDFATERESLMIVSDFAQKFFTKTLFEHKEGRAIGFSYLHDHRGISDALIEKFQLGYSPDQKDALTKEAQENGYKLEYLVKTGLTVQKETWTADRFSSRVIFPIHNVSGRVIAFGGRTLKTDKNIAKYLNSPESEIYSKSKILYGLFFAKKTIIQKDKCYLVEGYTDVISMHQASVENVVASSGTSLTVEQIRQIKRFTNNLTILYDGDFAGIKASLRGINLVLEEGMDVKVLLFPDGEDPDSYSRKLSSSEFLSFIEKNETDFITFKTRLLAEDSKNDPIKKVQLITDIVESVAMIPDTIRRSVYIKECSTIMDISEDILLSEVNKRRRKSAQKDKEEREKTEATENAEAIKKTISSPNIIRETQFEVEEQEIIRLLLNYGEKILVKEINEATNEEIEITTAAYIIREILKDELELTIPRYKKIFDEFQQLIMDNQSYSQKHFVNHEDNEITNTAADILSKVYPLSKIHAAGGVFIELEEMKLERIVPKTIIEYKNKVILSRMKDVFAQMLKAQETGDKVLFEELQQSYIAFTELKKQLSELLGGRIIV